MQESEEFRNILWMKKGTRLEKILCLVTLASLITVIIMTILLAYFGYRLKNDSSRNSFTDVCLKPGCVKAASAILSNLDETVDPCNDFYRFACGEWLKTHTIADDEASVSTFDEPEEKLNVQLKTLLETKLNGTEPSFIVKAKQLYDTCIDTKTIEEVGNDPLKKVLKNLGGWPVVEGEKWNDRKFDWLQTLINLRKLGYNHNILLSFFVYADAKNNSVNTIYVDETSLGLDRTYLIQGLNDSATAAYLKKMVKSAVLLGADESLAEKELLEALQFETTLANYSLPQEEKRDLSKFYNKYTIKALRKMIPQIPWLEYISGLLMKDIYENETLIISVPEFLKKFSVLIASTEKRVIANYMLWRVVDLSIQRLSKEWRDIDQEYFAVISGESKEKPRWKYCLANNLGIALSSYYVRHHFKDETKVEVSNIVGYIYKEFLRMLDKIDWMDDKTKSHAKAKANNMRFHIAYPEELLNNTAVEEYYKNLVTHNDSYFENYLRLSKWYLDKEFSMLRKPNEKNDWKKNAEVAVINAFYSLLDNSIVLPAGYLQNPFYERDRPNYLNFASIGYTIGHEITHGFDDEGRQFDKDGNNINWWEKVTDENFKKKAQCIIDQYSNYTAENGMKLNGVNTQGENIADNGGLKESYWAYQSWVKDNGPEQLLPGLKYNQNQLFWIGAAYEFCSKYRPEELKDRIISSFHSPDEFRVIGPMSNLVAFSIDFNCPRNSPMNSKKKCQVW